MLGYVDASIEVDLSSWSVTSVDLDTFSVVGAVLDVDLGVGVALVRLTVSAESLVLDDCRVT